MVRVFVYYTVMRTTSKPKYGAITSVWLLMSRWEVTLTVVKEFCSFQNNELIVVNELLLYLTFNSADAIGGAKRSAVLLHPLLPFIGRTAKA